ncbi:uncharacterized protein At1g10890-like [Cucurbita maxima]|uniref:Uncharacterized protein At1g10890-like n=1 Tax=Cucurbita maxima TaxID=3661 RepID=A0A6J1IG13_CUCMA|nr:uncharacterized protein At1g10890-like [Cucurbita maxima]
MASSMFSVHAKIKSLVDKCLKLEDEDLEVQNVATKVEKAEEIKEKEVTCDGKKKLEEDASSRVEELIQKNVEERLNSKEIKLEIQRRIKEGRKKLYDDVDVQLEKEKEAVTRQKEEQARKEREELDKMLEENRRRVEKAKRRLALELQWKEEELYRELALVQRQKEQAARRTNLDDKSLSYDIEAADENTIEENISSVSLAEASSPSSNKARNKRPPV